MANIIENRGDNTSKDTIPDFDSGKGHHWMYQVAKAREAGTEDLFPHKPRRTLAERSFFQAVDERLSRKSYTMGASFNSEGKIIKNENIE